VYWAASHLDLPALADEGSEGASIRTYNDLLRCLGERGFVPTHFEHSQLA
jgi:hypothetical protein